MKQLKAILALAAGICIFFACTSSNAPYPEAMQQAMRCMEERSDSALIYLSSLTSVIGNEPEETQMYYGLLKTKAEDKEYIRHTSDSLMKEVVHFYESHRNTEKLMEAYYYLGCVYRDMKDAPRAMVAFQKAIEVGGNTQQYDILGRVYEQMGTILAYQSLYEDALKAYKTSYAYNVKQKEGEGKGIVYALRNQGRMYEVLNRLDSAEYYYQKAYEKAFKLNDQQVINSISIEFGNVYIGLGKLDSAKNVFSRIPQFKNNAIYLLGIAQIHQLTSQADSARFYYLQTLEKGKQNPNKYLKSKSYKALAKLEAQKDNYQSAFDYALNSLKLEDTIKKETRTEEIGKINALYNYQHTEKENQQLLLENEYKRNEIYLLIIGLLIIFVSAIFYGIHIKKQKRLAKEQINRLYKQKEEQEKYSQDRLNKNRNEIQEIQKLLQQAKAEKEKKNSSLIQAQTELKQIPQLKARLTETEKELLKVKEKSLELNNELIKLKEYEKLIQKDRFEKTFIYGHFHEAALENDLKKIKEEDWITLVQEIDKAYNNFTDRLKTLYPSITQHELRMCYLIKANIAPSGIAKILCKSTSGVSNGRARLYQKISKQDGNGEMLDKLISDF